MTQILVSLKYVLLTVLSITAFASAADTIVVLGSSTAAGTGAVNPANAWVNRYQADFGSGVKVINLAVGGYVVENWMPTGSKLPDGTTAAPDVAKNITKAISYHPKAIILCPGSSNDLANGKDSTYIVYCFKTISAAAATAGIPYYLTTVQPRTSRGSTTAAAYLSVRNWTTSYYGTHSIEVWAPYEYPANSANIDPFWGAGDGIHLNDTAHYWLFQRVKAKNVLGATMNWSVGLDKSANGNVSPFAGVYAPGSMATITATANAGYVFNHWEGWENSANGSVNPLTITMDGDKGLNAIFSPGSSKVLNDRIESSADVFRMELLANNILAIKASVGTHFSIVTISGRVVLRGTLSSINERVDLSAFRKGLYVVKTALRCNSLILLN
jgi:lysophospholipase L1-like esterase